METVAHGRDEAREGLLVAALRLEHELGVHTLPSEASIVSTFERYGHPGSPGDSIFVVAFFVAAFRDVWVDWGAGDTSMPCGTSSDAGSPGSTIGNQ
jgi:hypothetical protein